VNGLIVSETKQNGTV